MSIQGVSIRGILEYSKLYQDKRGRIALGRKHVQGEKVFVLDHSAFSNGGITDGIMP